MSFIDGHNLMVTTASYNCDGVTEWSKLIEMNYNDMNYTYVRSHV